MATPEQIAAWRADIVALEAAYTKLIAGGQRVTVRIGDREISYGQNVQSDRAEIRNQIARLTALINAKRPGVGRINYATPF